MGAAKRFDTSSSFTPTDDDPELAVGFEWLGDEQTEPWCVDDGSRIVVMKTREIQRGLGGGTLDGGVKVWRDGRVCWLPAAEVHELRPDPEAEVEHAFSRIRRVRAPADLERATRPMSRDERRGAEGRVWWRRTLLMLFGR